MGQKSTRHIVVPRHISVTRTIRYAQRQPDEGYLPLQAMARLSLAPALHAYRQLSQEELVTVVETKRFLFIKHTTERRAPLSILRKGLEKDNKQLAMNIFGLVTEYPGMQGEYINLGQYGFPGCRMYRADLERIVNTYRNGMK